MELLGRMQPYLAIEETDHKHLVDRYCMLYKLADPGINSKEAILLKKAFLFIEEAYQGMPGNSGALYVHDALEVAIITADKFRIGMPAIISALLQDTISHSKTTGLVIQREFGSAIADIVMGLHNLAAAASLDLDKQVDNFKHILSSFSVCNVSIALIKIAEYLHKMRMVGNSSTNTDLLVTDSIKHIYIPLAHQLGLNHVQLELEDLHLKLENKAIYENIAYKIQIKQATKEGFLERFTEPIYAALKQENMQQFIIKGRTKSVSSIWHKLHDRHIPFEEMHDLYAVRIIFESKQSKEHSDCWLIYELITALYEPRLDRLRDWLTYPKDSGYEALHITVMSPEGQWVEVQIRSTRMDNKAEYGNAAHWKYKDQHLAKELVGMDKNWLSKARSFLIQQWKKNKKTVDICINKLYVKKPTKALESQN